MSKKILSMVMVVVVMMAFSISSINVTASQPEAIYGINSVQFTTINDYYLSLTMPSNGRLDVLSDLYTYSPYTARIYLELQQYTSSGWTTIKTWTSSPNTNYAYIESSYYVMSGYSYRLKGNFFGYQNGVLVEAVYDYSQTVNY